ncbi:MAG: hypothetical protein Q3962_05865 [Corynebacterium sp.]|nr:hypothetical protein [Corynebacterium sp.]
MKNRFSRPLAGAFAVALIGFAAPAVPVISGSLSAVALPPGGAVEKGEGTLSVGNPDGKVEAGGLLIVKGTGFAENHSYLAIKLDQTEPAEDFDGDDVVKDASDGKFYVVDSKVPHGSGDFEFTLRLPANISLGTHEIRVLDNNPAVSKAANFTVVEAAQTSENLPWYKKLFTSSGLSS